MIFGVNPESNVWFSLGRKAHELWIIMKKFLWNVWDILQMGSLYLENNWGETKFGGYWPVPKNVKVFCAKQPSEQLLILSGLKGMVLGNSFMVQWLTVHVSNTRGGSSIPGWGTKIPHTPRHGQKIRNGFKICCFYLETTRLYTWTSPDGQYRNQIDYILCSQRYSQEKQDQEMTVAQIMNSLLQNSGLDWRKYGKPQDHAVRT